MSGRWVVWGDKRIESAHKRPRNNELYATTYILAWVALWPDTSLPMAAQAFYPAPSAATQPCNVLYNCRPEICLILLYWKNFFHWQIFEFSLFFFQGDNVSWQWGPLIFGSNLKKKINKECEHVSWDHIGSIPRGDDRLLLRPVIELFTFLTFWILHVISNLAPWPTDRF